MSIHGRRLEAWTRLALEPPHAHGVPLAAVQLRATPEDFVVEEHLSFEPSDEGPHWLLRVEKRGANTRWVAAQLAQLAGIHPAQVGYAGLKDRHALTVQWFSVPAAPHDADFWSGVRNEEFRVLQVRGNLRKLKRGALSGNRFQIRLRGVNWSRESLESKLAAIRDHGVPNYFGPQRFGREGFNLDRVAEWIQSAAPPIGRESREFALSAARSLIFNALLARRIEDGDWSQLNQGDLAILDGSESHFAVDGVDDELRRRLREFDVHPSGPMWGQGEPQTRGQSKLREMEVAESVKGVAQLLAAQGLNQERRALRCAVRQLKVSHEGSALLLEFELGRGQFATAVLREICGVESA